MKIRALQILVGSGIVCVVAGLCLLVRFMPEDEDQSESTIQAPTSGEPEKTPSATQPKNTENKGSGELSKTETIATKAEDAMALSEEERAELARHLGILKMSWKQEAGIDEAIKGLAGMGDKTLDAIMKEFNRPDQTSPFRRRAIEVFGAMGTANSQKVLLDIALKRISTAGLHDSWAAGRYLAALKDKSDAAKLLVSANPLVHNTALLALKGQEIDEALLQRLKDLLESKLNAVRWASAWVMAMTPSPRYAEDKVSAIVAATDRVDDIPKAHETFQRGPDTHAEMEYSTYIGSLTEMRGAESALRNATERVSGMTRNIVVIARAFRGDNTARSALRKVLTDPAAGMMRERAAHAMAHIGTKDDIALLRRIAESDPLKRARGGCVLPPTVSREHYPVREAAQRTIREIESRTREKQGP